MEDIFVWFCLVDGCLFDYPVFLWDITSPFLSLWFKQNSLKSPVPWIAHNWSQASQRIPSFKHSDWLRNKSLTQSGGNCGTKTETGHLYMSLIPIGLQWLQVA